MKQSIKSGDYYDVIELKDDVTFSDFNFFICWLKDSTIHTETSKDYSEILQLYKTNSGALLFVELNSMLKIDGIVRNISDYRLISPRFRVTVGAHVTVFTELFRTFDDCKIFFLDARDD